MADTKATDESDASALSPADGFAGVQSGADVYITFALVLGLVYDQLFDDDPTLAADSDDLAPTKSAVVAYVAANGGGDTIDVREESGANYTFVSGDDGLIIERTHSADMSDILPQATGSFTDGWSVYIKNTSAFAYEVTPTTSSIDGGLALDLQPGDAALVVSEGGDYKAYVQRAATRGILDLTDGSSIATDASQHDVFRVVLAGSPRTLANPTGLSNGQKLTWIIVQDATGGRALAYDTLFAFEGGIAPAISLLANAKTTLEGVWSEDDDLILCSVKKDYGAALVYDWSKTWLRLPLNDADGSTTTADVSPSPLTVTLTGGAVVKTASAKFGASGLLLDGTNDYVSVGAAADAKFLHDGTTAWTYCQWAKFANFASVVNICDSAGGSSANAGLHVSFNTSRVPTVFISRAVAASFVVSTGINAATGAWPNDAAYHWLELSYDPSLTADACVLKVDGVVIASLTRQTSNAPSSGNPANALNIGDYGAGSGQFFNGSMDDIWITKEIVLNGIPTIARPVS